MQKKNFVNPAFAEIYDSITGVMPQITFYGIIGTYLITAALNVYFIPLPVYLSLPAALAIQFGRFAIVFMDFLNPTGRRSPWPGLIATVATVVAITELGFSIMDLAWTGPKFWATFLFGGMMISFGYLLEVNFISKGAEAFGMTGRPATQGAASAPAESTHYPAPAQKPAFKEESTLPLFNFEELGLSSNGNGRH
jgi:hypothetical protein